MKNFLLLILLLFIFNLNISFASVSPVLFFSDMESGPNNGWSTSEPSKGSAITIWGRNFGDIRGINYITVNGVDLKLDTDYAVWGEYWPTPFYQKITFWLNDSMFDGLGDIKITVDGVTSNSLPFTIRSGKIVFVTNGTSGGAGSIDDPYDFLEGWLSSDNWTPGDVIYFRGGQDYTRQASGGKQILWLRPTKAGGTSTHPISLIAFPGEKPVWKTPIPYHSNFNRPLTISTDYIVFSGFSLRSGGHGADIGGNYNRFIGNDVYGNSYVNTYGVGVINVSGNGHVVLGNTAHGVTSGNRLDHAIYISGCSPIEGNKVGWNYTYDNNFSRGPEFVINHQGDRCDPMTEIIKSHYVFNNIINCNLVKGRGIGVYDLSYDIGEPEPEPAFIYNNIIIGCGSNTDLGGAPALYHNNGHARFYNNTFFNIGYRGASLGGLSAYFRNNLMIFNPNIPSISDIGYRSGDRPDHNLSNNLYFGNGEYQECVGCNEDINNISNVDPLLKDPFNLDFNLLSGSLAINSGININDPLFNPPSYAPINRDIFGNLRQGNFDIGAFEYIENLILTPTCNYTYSDWTLCDSNSLQTRTVSTTLPSGCNGGTPAVEQSCTYKEKKKKSGGGRVYVYSEKKIAICKKEELECVESSINSQNKYIFQSKEGIECRSVHIGSKCKPSKENITNSSIKTSNIEKYYSKNEIISKFEKRIDKRIDKAVEGNMNNAINYRNKLVINLESYLNVLQSDSLKFIKKIKLKILKRNILNYYKKMEDELK